MRIGRSSILVVCTLLIFIFTGVTYGKEGMESFFKLVNPPTRNDYSGVTGIQFTTNEDVNVVALGRPVTAIFKQKHTITLWSSADKKVIAEVIVGTDSQKYKVENGDFAYEMLKTSVKLPKGETYCIESEEFQGGDNWATCYMITPGKETTEVAKIDGIPWGPIGAYPANLDATANKVDIGCTFFYGDAAKAVKSLDKLCITWANVKQGN